MMLIPRHTRNKRVIFYRNGIDGHLVSRDGNRKPRPARVCPHAVPVDIEAVRKLHRVIYHKNIGLLHFVKKAEVGEVVGLVTGNDHKRKTKSAKRKTTTQNLKYFEFCTVVLHFSLYLLRLLYRCRSSPSFSLIFTTSNASAYLTCIWCPRESARPRMLSVQSGPYFFTWLLCACIASILPSICAEMSTKRCGWNGVGVTPPGIICSYIYTLNEFRRAAERMDCVSAGGY